MVQKTVHSHESNHKNSNVAQFGLMFDIDGVIVRGRKLLPYSVEAFKKLVDTSGKFRVPTVFVTNAGNTLRHTKAEQLSKWLNIEISEDQVIMAHSPLKLFKEFHKSHVLVSGQGPTEEIAKFLGFQHVTTIEKLRHHFPNLDAIDHKRRRNVPCAFEPYFPKIKAILLFGEPVRWETSLQLILDVLMTGGQPGIPSAFMHEQQLPILACNMDLQWMAEASLPRFGHGAFLCCLESLYKKITSKELIYTALVGKPSEITYRHAEYCIIQHAKSIGITNQIKRLYAIGDNVNTDIYGANLYNRYLMKRAEYMKREKQAVASKMLGMQGANVNMMSDPEFFVDEDEGAVACDSLLVQTGVFNNNNQQMCDHSPRDFLPMEENLKMPSYIVDNVFTAVNHIFVKETFN
ncbi:Haloacid dehalogenase-like hydrolase domain-containing 5 [Nymphon striatum]|nr:Haloacid dehalogenase-like hydrolase domain-containing 5 [Nymphon striatum]